MEEKRQKVRVREKTDDAKTLLALLKLQEGAAHQPRNAGGLWKLEKAQKWILP